MAKPLTVKLDAPDYERLEDEAPGLGMRPGTLARVLLHASLSRGAPQATVAVATEVGADTRLAALRRLMALAKGRAPADAVRLVAEAREDLGAESAGKSWRPVAAVVEACLPIALITPDPKQAAVAATFRAWIAAGEELHALAVLPYEIANVLARLVWEGRFNPADFPQTWADLQALGISAHPVDFLADGPQVATIAGTLQRSHATDCTYISLALRLGCDVWTIDGPLARTAQAHNLPVQLLT
jgi:predicted nucleic acid-binding protein